jgi:pimeloyl-ACP methyl ester carboxylesterase
MQSFHHNDQTLFYEIMGQGPVIYIWAHGWGQDHRFLKPLAESLGAFGTHYLVDLPGFGKSPKPKEDWAVGDYAHFMASFVENLAAANPGRKIVWVGHSFGSRIGIKMGAKHPHYLEKLILIAAPGLKRRRSLWQEIKFQARMRFYKWLRLCVPNEKMREAIRLQFGSRDYVNAGALRGIFLKTIKENLGEDSRRITLPVLLIYGAMDDETPPDMGERYKGMMPNATLKILDGFDHYTLLSDGRHQTAQLIKSFVG